MRGDTFECEQQIALRALLALTVARYGATFAGVLEHSRVWRNGEAVAPDDLLSDGDEVAVLPPVSGGCAAAGNPARLRLRRTGC